MTKPRLQASPGFRHRAASTPTPPGKAARLAARPTQSRGGLSLQDKLGLALLIGTFGGVALASVTILLT